MCWRNGWCSDVVWSKHYRAIVFHHLQVDYSATVYCLFNFLALTYTLKCCNILTQCTHHNFFVVHAFFCLFCASFFVLFNDSFYLCPYTRIAARFECMEHHFSTRPLPCIASKWSDCLALANAVASSFSRIAVGSLPSPAHFYRSKCKVKASALN